MADALWDVTLVLLYASGAMLAGRLFCSAPDKLKKFGVMVLVIIGLLTLLAYYAADLFAHDPPREIKALGLVLCHLAVLLEIFRLYFLEHLTCKKLSEL